MIRRSKALRTTRLVAVMSIWTVVMLVSNSGWAAMIFLDNGTIKLGVDLSAGGAIGYLSESGSASSVINTHDLGRYVQQSYYSGPANYTPAGSTKHPNYANWPWNPVQAGDVYTNASNVLTSSNDGAQIYVKTQPKQWALSNFPADATMEQWITLDGNVATVRNHLVMARADTTRYGAFDQELPAVYTVSSLSKLMTYNGTQPFAGGALAQIPNNGPPWTYWRATENWAAYVNTSNWGLGVFVPGANRFVGGMSGAPGGNATSSSTGYISPLHTDILDHNLVYDYSYQLILGNLTDIRAHVYANKPELRPKYVFHGDREHWTYGGGARDNGAPTGDHLHVEWLANTDPQMIGPESAFQAAAVPTLFIRAAFSLSRGDNGQLFWETNNGASPFSENQSIVFPIINDGQYHTYALNLAAKASWTGEISRLRFDPAGGAAGGMDIQFISSAVPEPDALGLGGAGVLTLLGLGCAHRFRRHGDRRATGRD